jgi:hypothetical protein
MKPYPHFLIKVINKIEFSKSANKEQLLRINQVYYDHTHTHIYIYTQTHTHTYTHTHIYIYNFAIKQNLWPNVFIERRPFQNPGKIHQ